MIDLSNGQPNEALLPLDLINAASTAAYSRGTARQDEKAQLWLQYGDEPGEFELRTRIAAFLTDRYKAPAPISPQCLLITAGVSHGVDLCTTLLKPGDVVFVENPTYFFIVEIFRQRHLKVIGVPTDGGGILLPELERLAALHKPKMLYLVPTHSNPRGTTLSLAARKQLLAISAKHRFFLLADEVYQLLTFPSSGNGADSELPVPLALLSPTSSFVPDEKKDGGSLFGNAPTASAWTPASREALASSAEQQFPCVLSVSSFSKICCPGLRTGWLQAPPAIVKLLAQNGVILSGGCLSQLAAGVVNSLLSLPAPIWVANAACSPPGSDFSASSTSTRLVGKPLASACALDGYMHFLNGEYARRLQALTAAFRRFIPAAKFTMPNGGYFLWVEFPVELNVIDTDLLAIARKHRVTFKPGSACSIYAYSAPGSAEAKQAAVPQRRASGEAFVPNCSNCIRVCFARHTPDVLTEGVKRLAGALDEYVSSRAQSTSVGAGKSALRSKL